MDGEKEMLCLYVCMDRIVLEKGGRGWGCRR